MLFIPMDMCRNSPKRNFNANAKRKAFRNPGIHLLLKQRRSHKIGDLYIVESSGGNVYWNATGHFRFAKVRFRACCSLSRRY